MYTCLLLRIIALLKAHPCNVFQNSNMQSTGSQADICGNVDVSETVRSFQTQVQDLYNKTASLIDQLQTRGESIGKSDALLETLQSRVNEMVITGQALEDALQEGNQSDDDSSRELDDLIAERGISFWISVYNTMLHVDLFGLIDSLT